MHVAYLCTEFDHLPNRLCILASAGKYCARSLSSVHLHYELAIFAVLAQFDITMSGTVEPPSFEGYAAMSRFMNSSDGVTIFRRFGELHVRNLLYMQCQISELEQRIHKRDEIKGVEHGSFRRDGDPIRKRLMKKLRQLLQTYGQSIVCLANLHANPWRR